MSSAPLDVTAENLGVNTLLSPQPLNLQPSLFTTMTNSPACATTKELPEKSIGPETDEEPVETHFSPEEEANLLVESDEHKTTANAFFGRSAYGDAIQAYSRALGVCPRYLDYDIAVLRANISACHLKLTEWKQAIEAATEALEALERVDPAGVATPAPSTVTMGQSSPSSSSFPSGKADSNENKRATSSATSPQVQEIDEMTEERMRLFLRSGRATLADVRRIRTKALLRRAKAREETGGWASLQGAMEDYTALSSIPTLAPLDRSAVQTALRTLPQRLEETKQAELGDMMGKLKQLGNGLLKPFGLSTENFNFVKDENSGGYSVQFNQSP